MIGHGIKAAVKRQDWFAVAIEFVLVVVGVLMAFQISEWATLQTKLRDRGVAVDRLLHEAEQDVATIRDMREVQGNIVAALKVAAANVSNPAPTPALAETMKQGISWSSIIAKPKAPSSVYQQLIASGLFSDLGDAEMRDAVSAYATSMTYLDQSIDFARSGVVRTWPGDAIHFATTPRMIATS
jgi:hypothetical protein